jgi:serine/threonine protein kinase
MVVAQVMPEIPEMIGPFRLLSILGRGGMGVVYRAEHVTSGEVVALKTVPAAAGVERSRIHDEIQALRSIDHPGVVRILAEGSAAGVPWYAMELVEGRTLAAWIERLWQPFRPAPPRPGEDAAAAQPDDDGTTASGFMTDGLGTTQDPDEPPRPAPRAAARRPAPERVPAGAGRLLEVLTLAHRLCAPLAFIHGEGLVHRDIKPANIFVRDDGTPLLMDFGMVSRALGTVGREALEAGGKVVGTAAYLAPEQARARFVDARADLYALGCVLYEMTTGRAPFGGATISEILQKHMTALPPPPSERASGVPPALEALILRLLAKERRSRIGYADDVAAALAELGADTGGPRAAPPARSRGYLYRPEMVGRTAILAGVCAEIEAASAGRGALLVLGGESGIGKTFLLAEIAREASARRMRVVLGECVAFGVAGRADGDAAFAPLGPLRPLLRAVAAASIAGGREVADRLLGPRGRLLAAYEPAIAAVPGHDAHPAPPELPPEAARERLLAELGATLAAFAERAPVLLVIDDLQWADELSLRFLGSLTADTLAARGLVVLAAYRSEEASEALRAVVGAPHARELTVGRLDEDGTAALVGHMLAMPAPPAPFVRFLVGHSEGNPFFVAEYLRAAVAAGHLRRRDGAWDLADEITAYQALPLPRSLRDLVRVRLDALSGPARELAELGAVLGRELDADLLAAAARREEGEVRALLRELRARQVLEPIEDGRVRFGHDKVREVAYAALDPARLRALHLAAAEAIEVRSGADDARSAELGYHFQRAGEVERAALHLERAGEFALGKLAHLEATRHFEDVIALEPRLRARAPALRRARWHTRIAEAEHALGRPASGRAHAERAAALLDLPVPNARPLVALDALGELGTQALHRAFPDRFVSAVTRPSEALQQAARTYHVLMKCSFLGGDSLAILHATLRCLNLAERAGPSPTLANAYAASSCTAAMLSLGALSRAYSRRAHATLDRAEDGPARSFALAMDALSHLARAEWEAMYAAADEGTAIGKRLGFVRRVDEIQTTLAWAELVRGELVASEARYARMRAASPRGATQADLWIRVGLAAIHVERDRLDEALEELHVPEERAAESAQRTELLGIRTLRAVVHLRRGDRRAARRAAEEALGMIRAAPPSLVSLPSYERVAEVFAELQGGARNGAEQRAERSRGSLERAELSEASLAASDALARGARLLPIWRPAALLARGFHAWCAGQPARAWARWEACLAAARTLGMPHHAARAALALGRHGPAAGRRAHAEEALDTFTRLGAAHHRERCLAALGAA